MGKGSTPFISLNGSAVTCLRASTSLEPRMYTKYDVYFSFNCTVCQLDSTEGWCLQSKTKTGTPTQGWSQLHTTSQWIYRKLTSGYWRKLLFMYESSAYRGLDQVCFIHPWLANWFFFWGGGSLDLRGHRLYPSQISVRYRINESSRLNIFNLNNPSATALSASNGWRGWILVFLLTEGMAAPLIPCHPAYCAYSRYLLLNELVMLTTSERPCFSFKTHKYET